MSQQPFTRPGAVDLTGLAQTPGQSPGQPAGASAAQPSGLPGSYAVAVDEQNFQQVLESSMTAPVVLVFFSAIQAPGSEVYARDVAAAIGEHEGKFLAGLIDVDTAPQIAQAMQVPQVPLLYVLIDGRPATQPIPGVLNAEELSTIFSTLGQQLTAQGITGRHKPQHAAGADGEPVADPRYAAAQDALEAGDMDRAVTEYQKLVDANPADVEAGAGLAMAKVLQRTQGVDLQEARAAAAAAPDDVDAQIMVADMDMLGGHVEDAFGRLVELVRRTVGDDRDKTRDHLIGLFAAVGNDDPRVLRGRQNLASALF